MELSLGQFFLVFYKGFIPTGLGSLIEKQNIEPSQNYLNTACEKAIHFCTKGLNPELNQHSNTELLPNYEPIQC